MGFTHVTSGVPEDIGRWRLTRSARIAATSPPASPPDLSSGLVWGPARCPFRRTLSRVVAVDTRASNDCALATSELAGRPAANLRSSGFLPSRASAETIRAQDGLETARGRHFLRPPFREFLAGCTRWDVGVKSQLRPRGAEASCIAPCGRPAHTAASLLAPTLTFSDRRYGGVRCRARREHGPAPDH